MKAGNISAPHFFGKHHNFSLNISGINSRCRGREREKIKDTIHIYVAQEILVMHRIFTLKRIGSRKLQGKKLTNSSTSTATD
jgi:hypothetical protein